MNPASGLTLRLAEQGDATAILRLLQTAFDEWPAVPVDVSALEHLEWKMQPPGGLPAHHTIGLLDGEAVAVDLRWMGYVSVHGQTLLSNAGAEIAVHPAYQGQGFSRAIRDHEIRRNQPGELTLVTANDQRADRYQTSMFIEDALRLWVRPLGVRARVRVLRAAGIFRTESWRALSPGSGRPPARAAGSYRGEEQSHFDDRFDALWEAAHRDFDLIKVRDAEYLSWRYADPRSGRTLIRVVHDGDALVGYAVFRPGISTAEMLDLLVDPRHPAAAQHLLSDAVEAFRARGASSVSAALPAGHPYEAALRGPGPTVRVGRPPNATVDLDEARLAGAGSRLHVTIGDFEYA